jgi:copper chaperone CopZ
VRSDLKAVDGVANIATNLDEKTASFEIDATVDVAELIERLAETNNKMLDWTYTN